MDHLCAKFFYTFNEFTTVNVALLCTTCSSPKAKGTLVMEQHWGGGLAGPGSPWGRG